MAFKISCPRLTPLQSRVAVSSFATVLMITLLVLWTLPPSAYSQSIPDLGSGHRVHHHHPSSETSANDRSPVLEGFSTFFNPLIQSTEESQSWADTRSPEGAELHDLLPGVLQERQGGPFLNSLVKDQYRNFNIKPGEVQLWGLDTEQLFADAGRSGSSNVFVDIERNSRIRTVYFGFNTCWGPTAPNNTRAIPPNLTLYASNATANKSPGPSANPRQQIVIPVIEGFANVTLNVSSTVYLSVVAPNITAEMGNFTGFYNYEIIASTKRAYYGWYKFQNLYLIDSDSSNALLISGNETAYDKATNVSAIRPPYTFFAHPANDTAVNGLRRSWCGLKARASLSASSGDISMTRRGLGNKVKEQIYLKGLKPNTTYNIWLAKQNNETEGGFIYSAVNLTTKSDGNCRVIYDLQFCSEVAYAVPTNDTIFQNMPHLARFYDTYASSWYANFSYSLQQVQCNTTSDREYSHLRSCDDCDKAYKTWLCATTIPRCADYSSDASFLAERSRGDGQDNGPTKIFLEDGRIVDIELGNVTNDDGSTPPAFKAASRNILIDEVVSPGPYKEIKPCMDLCWSLIQSCPASLGFSCPSGSRGENSYGWRSDDGDITCSYLGAAYFLSKATRGMGLVGGGGGGWALVVGLVVALMGVL
ncbi:stretch-activated cation channel mid1 [Orbilia oligospora]|uniref:Stretch-activated cation channel mid1 n=1 Tax=Orbilia oligospora TaxID=2813651 RepID=A0A7C8NER6_ORBOL|nr:stretch-activated cation channel mid1 [Orbilia oligospora]KAF3116010.1 stretch-activated cation channel mid1 [Orbilia oligospora]KAF3149703.1 stretch-activated cation channel mid1 [Orbilia oligospora]KAF3155967.1 stretch-activated cation channel mid1 [Orbilia oligospora]